VLKIVLKKKKISKKSRFKSVLDLRIPKTSNCGRIFFIRLGNGKGFVINAVLLIWIRPGSHRFAGSGSGLVDWHPGHSDPDRYQFQENVIMLSKILKIMTHLTLMRKIEHGKLAMLRLKVKKNKSDFPICVKLSRAFATTI
jgi:hypothetical protein